MWQIPVSLTMNALLCFFTHGSGEIPRFSEDPEDAGHWDHSATEKGGRFIKSAAKRLQCYLPALKRVFLNIYKHR